MTERIPGFHEIEGRLRDLEEDRGEKMALMIATVALCFALSTWLDLRSYLKEREAAHVD